MDLLCFVHISGVAKITQNDVAQVLDLIFKLQATTPQGNGKKRNATIVQLAKSYTDRFLHIELDAEVVTCSLTDTNKHSQAS